MGVGVAVEVQLAEQLARTGRLGTDERHPGARYAQHVGLARMIQAGHIRLLHAECARLQ